MGAPIKITTPKGVFNSIWEAARAYKMTCQGMRVRMLKDPHNYYALTNN